MKHSVARNTLGKARFFLNQAELCETSDREAFEAYLAAAIVFARSITFHIQKEYRHQPNFENWYSHHEAKMRDDPICKFFIEKRNLIVKEGIPSLKGLSFYQE